MFFIEKPSLRRWAMVFPVFLVLFVFSQTVGASTISGFVYVKSSRVALPDIDVELLNNDNQMRNRTKTDGSGRYTFGGLPDGRYTVRVMAFRYDFEDQEAMVEIVTISVRGQGIGTAVMTQDFYMSPRRGSLMETETAVVFAQEVPPEAKRLYDTAVNDISKARVEDGVLGLRNALAIFPKYYSALNQLGLQLFLQKKYGESAQIFMRASAVNEKSATSLYYNVLKYYSTSASAGSASCPITRTK